MFLKPSFDQAVKLYEKTRLAANLAEKDAREALAVLVKAACPSDTVYIVQSVLGIPNFVTTDRDKLHTHLSNLTPNMKDGNTVYQLDADRPTMIPIRDNARAWLDDNE